MLNKNFFSRFNIYILIFFKFFIIFLNFFLAISK